MRLPPRPDLEWKPDGTPVDRRFGDIYYSVEDGLAESRVVFLQACGLPQRWRGRDQFTVAELGFGTGLNFLALWDMWRTHRTTSTWLHFVSFEGYPLDHEDAARALGIWPELAALADKLLASWPDRALGVQHIVWPDERLSLTLHIGQIQETLQESTFKADAWFLDGFSPALNGDMWGEGVWSELAERSAPGAVAATFTVAGAVRRGLESAGFEVFKRPGHGRKRERLEAVFAGAGQASSSQNPHIAVIGAGIAGASVAHALTQRGATVSVFDPASGPAQGTSGNPLALVMPRLDAGDTAEARLLVDAYLSSTRTYATLPGCTFTEVVHRPKDVTEAQRFEKVLADPPLGLEHLEAIRDGGILHKRAMIIRPADLLPALLAKSDVRWGEAATLDLSARTVNGEVFDAIALASGTALSESLPWLRLQPRMGQVNHYQSAVEAGQSAIASGHYALASGHDRLWGATFESVPEMGITTSDTASATNAQALEALNPYWRTEARKVASSSRVGVRATTPDRLPVMGAVPDYEACLRALADLRTGRSDPALTPMQDGLYLSGGFGSRGFTWGPWAAAALAADILGGPSPITRSSRKLIAPDRQIRRDLKRRLI